jgi:hypothetical protein
VKGKTENALLRLPFKAAYMLRPAYIQPMHGIRSKTKLYRALYLVMAPLYPVWKVLLPKYVTTTEQVGRAMIKIAKLGATKRVLENQDINSIQNGGISPQRPQGSQRRDAGKDSGATNKEP